MGAVSTLLLLDGDAVRDRVGPALRAWIAGDEPAGWWLESLRDRARALPDPADREAWSGLAPRDDDHLIPDPARSLSERTRDAFEVALVTAAAGDALAFGNARWLGLDLLDDLEPVLDPGPAPGSTVASLIERLDTNLLHLNHGSGGFGEGLRGWLDAGEVHELAHALSAHGSHPVDGPVENIRAAIDRTDPPRQTAVALHGMAQLADRGGRALLHGRDLAIDHLGTWDRGVLRRDPG